MTLYKLVLRTARGAEEYTVEDPEIRDGYVCAQYFKRPLPRSRMCKAADVESMTIIEEARP